MLAWQHLRELHENGCAPPPCAVVTKASHGGGLGSDTTSVKVVGDHVCGPACPHVVLDDTGYWTCGLTGLILGCQLSNGSFDRNRFMDDVFVPTPRARSKRTWNADDFFPIMIAACTQALNQLLNAEKRDLVDKIKLDKARKAATRLACAELEKSVTSTSITASRTVMDVCNLAFTEFEKLGGNPVRLVMTPSKVSSIASIAAQIYGTVVVPYVKVDTKKPVHCYYAVAVMYMLANGTFGKSLQVPLLAAVLPDEKSLKNLGFIVSRMTSAKRYILDALNYYLQENQASKRLKRGDEEDAGAKRIGPDTTAAQNVASRVC